MKDTTIHVRLNKHQAAKLAAIQEHLGVNRSEAIVALVNEATLALLKSGAFEVATVEVIPSSPKSRQRERLIDDRNAGKMLAMMPA